MGTNDEVHHTDSEEATQENIPKEDAFQAHDMKEKISAKTVLNELSNFNVNKKTNKDLIEHIVQLNCLLQKVVLLLKEKTSLCHNLQEQNVVLALQSDSLKKLAAVTKDLLAVRNTEVEQLYEDIKHKEERIDLERNRHENLVITMTESAKLNEDIRAQYHSQVDLFNDLRARYEEKVALLEAENWQLSRGLAKGGPTPPGGKQTGDDEAEVQGCDEREVDTGECGLCGQPGSSPMLNGPTEHSNGNEKPPVELPDNEGSSAQLCSLLDQSSGLRSETNTSQVTGADKGYGEGGVRQEVISDLGPDNGEKVQQLETGNNPSPEIFAVEITETVVEAAGKGEGELFLPLTHNAQL